MDRNLKWVFTVPTCIFVVAMVLFPILYTTILSFHSWRLSANIPWKFVGIQNYVDMFTDSRFLRSVWRTFYFSFVALSFETLLGVSFALLLNRKFRGKNLIKTAFLLPMVATPVAISMVWKLMYEPSIGIFNFWLRSLGMRRIDWLGSTSQAIYSLIIVDIWQGAPMIMLIVSGGLTALPTEPLESAMVDGASAWQKLCKITLPLLSPTIFTAVLLRLIDVLKTFDVVYSLTLGGPAYSTETMNILAFRQAFEYMEFGTASATLVVFLAIVMLISFLLLKIRSWVEVDL